MNYSLKYFTGRVKTGIGEAVFEMSKPGDLEGWEALTGLRVIPGTLNLQLTEPFDLSLLRYLSFSEIGWNFDPTTQGFDFKGDVGMHYNRVIIAGKYQGILALWTWVPEPNMHAELISPVHIRTTLGIEDGDIIKFSLYAD
jgi:CTP-dependent riboflavin kinase